MFRHSKSVRVLQVAWVLLANSFWFSSSFWNWSGTLGTVALYVLWLVATSSDSQGHSHSAFGNTGGRQQNEAPRSRALGEALLDCLCHPVLGQHLGAAERLHVAVKFNCT